jgi:hypothetical protein
MSSGNLLISAQGKTIGIRFGFQALMGMSAHAVFDNESVQSEGQKSFLTAATVQRMAWHGYQNWCLYMDQTPELSYQEFFDFMDTAYMNKPSLFSDIFQAFNDSQSVRKKDKEDDEKKILTQSN